MQRRHYVIVAVVFCVAAAAVPAWKGLIGLRATRTQGPPAAAWVNGRPIPQEDLDLRLGEILPMASYHGRIEPARLLGLRRAALDALVLDELIFQTAAARGVRAPASEIERHLEQARTRFATAREFAQALAEVGLTEQVFRERLERLAIIRSERAAHRGHEPTDTEVRAYYEANGAKFERPEQVHLFEILISVDPAVPGGEAAAEQRARGVARRIRRGEPFGPLAREMSQDEYRVMDGDFGFVHRGRLDSDLEAAVFEAEIGRVTVARTMRGFHVFRVTERKPAVRLTLDEARPSIVDRLRRHFRDEDMEKWRRDLLAGAQVEIADAALRTARPAAVPEFEAPGPARSPSGGLMRAQPTGEAG